MGKTCLIFLLVFTLLLCVQLAEAVTWSPQGDISLKNRYDILDWNVTSCSAGETVQGINSSGQWVCVSVGGDIEGVNTNGPYLEGGCSSGECNITVNGTVLNDTIDDRDSDTTYSNGTGVSLIGTTFSIIFSYFADNFILNNASFGGDVSGNYTNIIVNDGSHTHPWENLTDYPVACPAGTAITQLNDSITCTTFSSYQFADNNFNGSGNFVTTGNVTASYFIGDGSLLTGITGGNLSWNQSLANTLYSSIIWNYNQTTATYNLYNSQWISTFNSTYDAKISYDSTNIAFLNQTNVFAELTNFSNNVTINGANLIIKDGANYYYTGVDSYGYPGFFSPYGDFFFGISGDPTTYFNYYTGSRMWFGYQSNNQSVTIFGNLTIKDLINCDTIDTDANGFLTCGTDATGGGAGDGNASSICDGTQTYLDGDGNCDTLNDLNDFTDTGNIYQNDVYQSCSAGYSIRAISDAGAVTCEYDNYGSGCTGESGTVCVCECGGEPPATPYLYDWNGTFMRKIANNLLELRGVSMIPLEGYNVKSNFTFTILNNDSEIEYFDYVALNQRCHFGGIDKGKMRYKQYSSNIYELAKDNDYYLFLETGDFWTFSFSSVIIPEFCKTADFITYQLEVSGYYEKVSVIEQELDPFLVSAGLLGSLESKINKGSGLSDLEAMATMMGGNSYVMAADDDCAEGCCSLIFIDGCYQGGTCGGAPA